LLVPALAAALVALVAVQPTGSQTGAPAADILRAALTAERIDAEMNAKIREEGLLRSDLQRITHHLTDIYGPRVTGTPNLEHAAKWAIETMEGWGLRNGRLEPWDWGREGWLNERASGHIIAPVKDRLEFEVLAWTPSTEGTVTAEAVYLVPPLGPPVGGGSGRGAGRLGPTEAELTAYLDAMATKVKGAIVLVGAWSSLGVDFTRSPMRIADEQVRGRYSPPDPNAPAAPARGGRGAGRGRGPIAAGEGRLLPPQVSTRVADFLRLHRPALRIFDAARPHGQIAAYNVAGYNASQTVPTILMRNEDYGRIARILEDGTRVTLEFTIVNRTFPDGKTAHNAVADFVGTDKADEIVMLGGHLDSWHAATGATDNAIGCAIAMEAVRILRAVGARPRRTIRVGLWSGEEQGLLGSRAYVAGQFGTAEEPKPAYAKLNAYWNVDGGTGRIRGATVFGPPEAAAVLAAIFKPFEDFGIFGALSTRSRNTGGTDSTSFNAAGLPGINASQDPVEYESHTHHTNLDTYERIAWDDVRKAAVITASVAYHLAIRDQMLPRFTADTMPAAPAGRGRGAGP
jgi:hypothetical protein